MVIFDLRDIRWDKLDGTLDSVFDLDFAFGVSFCTNLILVIISL